MDGCTSLTICYTSGLHEQHRRPHGAYEYALRYLICGILAASSHTVTDPSSTVPMVGASDAISGVLGAQAGIDTQPWPHEGGSGYRPRHVVCDATLQQWNEHRRYRWSCGLLRPYRRVSRWKGADRSCPSARTCPSLAQATKASGRGSTVHLVCLVRLVYLVERNQPEKPDRPKSKNHPVLIHLAIHVLFLPTQFVDRGAARDISG